MNADKLVDTTEVGDDTVSKQPYSTLLNPMRGRGKELCDLLRKELLVPDGVKSFDVRFAVDKAISVRCEYTPRQ